MGLTAGQEQAMTMVRKLVASPVPILGVLKGFAGCHKRGQLIMKFDGNLIPVENLEVGDLLMGPDSTPRTILSLARGRGEMVKITPVKGESFVVNMDHILTLKMVRPYSPRTVDVSVREWLTWPPTKRFFSKLFRVGVIFAHNHSALPIDPYFLGVLIGDGGLTAQPPKLTTTSPQVKKYCEDQAQRWGLKFFQTTDKITYTFSKIKGKKSPFARGRENPLTRELSKLGLMGKGSAGKYIPHEYKTASRQDRLSMLAGLMDTDGSVSCGGFDYITKSPTLAADLCFLAKSVGLAAYSRPSYKEDQYGTGGLYMRVFISGDCSVIPTLDRKAPQRRQIKDVKNTGISVEVLEGEDDYFGFSLDGDQRFLLGDFTVTHNTGKTWVTKMMGSEFGDITIITPTGVAANRVKQSTGLEASTIHRWRFKAGTDPQTGKPVFTPRPLDEMVRPQSGLIVIDESSMVDADIWFHIWTAATYMGCSVLAVGDPFQLGPVTQEGEYFNLLQGSGNPKYEVMMTEIMRQALESPIIRASMLIREGNEMDAMMMLPRVMPRNLIEKAVAIQKNKGAIICHTNKMRFSMNDKVRTALGMNTDGVEDGEPLLILHNNYEINRFNGEVGTFSGWDAEPEEFEFYDHYNKVGAKSMAGIGYVDGQEVSLVVDAVTGKLPPKMGAKALEIDCKRYFGKDMPYMHASFGYTLSCHKSQGSEFPEVLVLIENSIKLDTDEGRHWAYTAITRSISDVSLCFVRG